VRLVISDAHPGLIDAIASTLPGASWQRYRNHFLRNLLTRVPKSAGPFVATLVRSIFAQPDAPTTHMQHTRVIEQLAERFRAAAEMLEDACSDILSFARFPQPDRRQIWSNNPQERFEQRDPPPHRRRRHLPQPRLGDPFSSALVLANSTTSGPSFGAT
jgi:putative transposase